MYEVPSDPTIAKVVITPECITRTRRSPSSSRSENRTGPAPSGRRRPADGKGRKGRGFRDRILTFRNIDIVRADLSA